MKKLICILVFIIPVAAFAQQPWLNDSPLDPGWKYVGNATFSAGVAAAPAVADSAGLLDLPFTETWDQGFSASNWILPSPDNNWIIDTTAGNPPPCANFWCQPYRFYFSQALISDTLDAMAWTCASILLEFDMKINAYNTLGDEVLKVELYRNGSWKQLALFNDHGSTGWLHYKINIDSVQGQICQLIFVVEGTNSADVSNWYLDNIMVTPECRSPRDLWGFYTNFTTHLTWRPPDCHPTGTPVSVQHLIFDDGSWESGLRMNAGELGWFGNEFPVWSTTGMLQNVSLYFMDNGSGTPQTLSVDIYNAAHNLLGSSPIFDAGPANTWIDVPLPSIAFSNDFFAMVKFNSLPGDPYYLALDENGPWAATDLAWHINANGNWSKATAFGTIPGVFLCRATILAYGDAPIISDSATLLGYDIYRSQLFGSPPFSRCNTSLLADTSYYDVNINWPWFHYFVKAVFRNQADSSILCEPASDTIMPLYVGNDNLTQGRFVLAPNPANNLISLETPLTNDYAEIFVTNLSGQTVLSRKITETKTQLDISALPAGVYFVRVTGEKTVQVGKLIKL
ncbi:MAG: T9SS type A sorting domain-containing protein [Bacteroidota bacterium]